MTRQIEGAAARWATSRVAAPKRFKEGIERGLSLIRAQPGMGVRSRNPRHRDVRRIYLDRFGYHLYYRFSSAGDVVEVIEIRHARRGTLPVGRETPAVPYRHAA